MKEFFIFLVTVIVINLIWTLFWGYVNVDFFWQVTLLHDANPASVIPRFANAAFEIAFLGFALFVASES